MTDKIDRRDVIKGLATLPVAMALDQVQHGLPEYEKAPYICPPNTLCLWFHGPWAFVFTDKYIAAITPCVGNHSYFISDRKPDCSLSGPNIHHLLRGKFKLEGVLEGNIKCPPAENTLIIAGVDHVYFDRTYLWIRLPFPQKITGAYKYRVSLKGPAAPCLKVKGSVAPCLKEVFTAYAFEYAVSSIPQLALAPMRSWFPSGQPEHVEKHIYAELWDDPRDAAHVYQTFEGLVNLFPKLDLRLAADPPLKAIELEEICTLVKSQQNPVVNTAKQNDAMNTPIQNAVVNTPTCGVPFMTTP